MAETGDEVRGEHALQNGEADRLGFGEIAERIARAIVDRASTGGLVIGIDGRWGSGKSSLLHLIERSLARFPERSRPTIRNFLPWLMRRFGSSITSSKPFIPPPPSCGACSCQA